MRKFARATLSIALALAAGLAGAEGARPWMDAKADPDLRAGRLMAAMTPDEKLLLVFGYFATPLADHHYTPPPEGRPYSAGYVPGVARLGIPAQWQTDAGSGVATQAGPPASMRERTALPSGLALAASWNPQLAYAAGAMIGNEAHLSGHNVLLAGGVNLMREPRNGRNFEYAGEDPLLAGSIVGEAVRGIQDQHVMATVKHFAFNDQESNRNAIDVQLRDAAARLSDLLAFQFAIERGHPAAVMCGYNRVGGVYACESDHLLRGILKGDWAYPGYVMSDWGATHSTVTAALAGLDQQSGAVFDKSPYFAGALQEALADGLVPPARLDDMLHRILRGMFAQGLFDDPSVPAAEKIDVAAHAMVSQRGAEEGMVLLKNDGGLLPLAPGLGSVAVIGGHADVGVLSGGGSSQVYGHGGSAVTNEGPTGWPGPVVYYPSSPLRELAGCARATFTYRDGKDVAAAAALAASSDVAIVFATQWAAESVDLPSLALPDGQDALIAAVAAANPRTVVVLETGGPVTMPWLPAVGAVLEAWYPGSSGGAAIARVLSGEVNPSGHLPASFPRGENDLPRAVVDGGARVDYDIEGAAVGYKWFDLKKRPPLFAFGHGLSYTRFAFAYAKARLEGGTVRITFQVRNTGDRTGQAVPQVYASGAGWEAPKRLAGWRKLELKAGASDIVSLDIDPRLFAVYDNGRWKIAAGDYLLTVADSAVSEPAASVRLRLPARSWRDRAP